MLRKRPPLEGLDTTLLTQRNEIREVLGRQWWQALLLSAGRLAFDYLCLLAALRATGSHPRPSLILVAYAVAGIIGLIPITPGGLGIVEASLTGLKDLPLLRPIAQKLNFNLDDSSMVHTIRSVIEARTSTLAAVALGLLVYGILQFVEATGLWLLKRWGEYFAVVATSLGLPIEVYELTEKITVIRVGALVINVAAVIYLLLTKRLFGLRGGKKAYEEERHEASLLEVEAAGEDRKVRAATGTG